MIVYDIEKVQKLKKLAELNPSKNGKIQKKISKIESRYFSAEPRFDDNITEKLYYDKKGNAVVVLKDGLVLQIRGKFQSSMNPKFISFMFAYFILLAIAIPVMFGGIFFPEMERYSTVLSLVVGFLAIILNVLTIVFCFGVVKKIKWLLLALVFTLVLNISSLIENFSELFLS